MILDQSRLPYVPITDSRRLTVGLKNKEYPFYPYSLRRVLLSNTTIF